MSDTTTIEENNTPNENAPTMPGELACFWGKAIAWIMLLVSGFYGLKFVGAYMQIMVNGQSALKNVDPMHGVILVSGITSAIVLFILIAICENLMLMNKK
ncbi:MAG: hypothetical protein JKY55_17255 [Aliivibrio sp.]|uniref:hypothetical protein n=1 Tax=Aliivibrio sp. TaxID=1872443 RepID=UPI001A50B64B|nr:hypothetical protein [Aliivibrio sp.]